MRRTFTFLGLTAAIAMTLAALQPAQAATTNDTFELRTTAVGNLAPFTTGSVATGTREADGIDATTLTGAASVKIAPRYRADVNSILIGADFQTIDGVDYLDLFARSSGTLRVGGARFPADFGFLPQLSFDLSGLDFGYAVESVTQVQGPFAAQITNRPGEVSVRFNPQYDLNPNFGQARFRFDAAPVSPVPLPAAGLMLIAGLGALGLRRRG